MTSVPNSPRIDPASASTGSVTPINCRAALIEFGPSSTIATSGPPVMKEDELAEEALLGVLGVVLVGDRVVRGHQLQGDETQALALEARDDLAGQAPLEGVRLDQDQGAVVCHGRES